MTWPVFRLARTRLAIGVYVVVLLHSLAGCKPVEPAARGSGWPNVVLSEQTAVLRSGTQVRVYPVRVGPAGATFEVSARSSQPQRVRFALTVDDEIWALASERISAEGAHGYEGSVHFENAGPSIGPVVLEVFWDGERLVYRWRI